MYKKHFCVCAANLHFGFGGGTNGYFCQNCFGCWDLLLASSSVKPVANSLTYSIAVHPDEICFPNR